jgi:hypothetical protein
MAKQPWLEAVERRLLAGKLPPEYIRRFMDELADHFDDITEETMSKEANVLFRLGEADQVADAAVVAYNQQSFFSRHPSAKFWFFGVSPLAAMISTFVLACLGIAAIGEIINRCGIQLSGKNWLGGVDPAAVEWGLTTITTILPAALLTFVYCKFARRFGINKKWMLVSCCVLAFVAMLPIQGVIFSDLPGKSLWKIGLGLCLPPSLMQCIQLLVPLLLGWWFMRHGGKQVSHEDRLSTAT